MSKKRITSSASLKERKQVVTNPHGANQWVKDPRQGLFLSYWKDPTSETFSDVKNSAIRAGFAPEYADNLTSILPDWLLVAMGQVNSLLDKANRNLEEFLELPNETQAVGMYGPIFEKIKTKEEVGKFKNGKPKFKTKTVKIPVMTLNPKVMKIKQDSTHFIAETIGKSTYNKKEGDGGIINNIFIFENDQRNKIAQRIIDLRRGSVSDRSSA